MAAVMAPGAAATAPGAGFVGFGGATNSHNPNRASRASRGRVESSGVDAFLTDAQPSFSACELNLRARLRVRAEGPSGAFTVTGKTAKALLALVEARGAGVTALEVASWAYRLGAYVHDLRHDCRLANETKREPHEGGWHGRYVLRSPVAIRQTIQPGEGA